ncbi:MAG: prepilin peptidase [Ignisphaera sp.]
MIEIALMIIVKLLVLYPSLPPLILYLSIATWYDLRYREIDDALILAGIPGAVSSLVVYTLINGIGSLISVNTVLSVIVGGVLVSTSYLLARKGQMGSGDVPIVLLTTLFLLPYTIKFYGVPVPLVLVVMVLGITYVVAEVVVNVVHNARRIKDFAKATSNCRALEKVYYFLVTKVFKSEEFRNLRFYFPVKHGEVKRFTSRVGLEPMEGSEYEILGDMVLAMKGLPFIAVLLTGTILSTLWLIVLQPMC